jgi:hypothetical protein
MEKPRMCTFEMPRSDKEFRLDDRILEALKRVKEKTGMSVNSYVENLLFHHLKGAGEIPMTEQPLPEARGGKRSGAGKPKTVIDGVTIGTRGVRKEGDRFVEVEKEE